MAEPYATVDDLACDVLDESVAQKLIARASLMVRAACKGDPADLDAARVVVSQMVERALASHTADEFGPTPQTLQSISQYSQTWTWGNPVGDLYIKAREYQMLGLGGYAGFAAPSYGRLEASPCPRQ